MSSWPTSPLSRRNLSPGEMHALNVLRTIALPVISRENSITRESVHSGSVARLVRRGFVTITEEDGYEYVQLTERGETFLAETFSEEE